MSLAGDVNDTAAAAGDARGANEAPGRQRGGVAVIFLGPAGQARSSARVR